VLIGAGSYRERVAINSKVATLIGTGADLSSTGTGPLVEVTGDSDIVIEGLLIHDGMGGTGDGLRCLDSGGEPSVSLVNVTLRDNTGQGIEANNCQLTVDASSIIGNVGGGIVANNSDVLLTATTVAGNAAGGIVATGGVVSVSSTMINANTGGGISMSMGSVSIRNNFIVKNGGPSGSIGGVSLIAPTALTFDFNTVADNTAVSGFAAGVQCSSTMTRTLSNNIVVGLGNDQLSGTNCQFTYTLSNESVSGIGNSGTAPMFVNASSNDYHLQAGSSGVDRADPAATLMSDYDGDPRPNGMRADIGADEIR